MYVEYTLGMTAKDLSSKYGVNVSNINYYIDLIKMLGIKILGVLVAIISAMVDAPALEIIKSAAQHWRKSGNSDRRQRVGSRS